LTPTVRAGLVFVAPFFPRSECQEWARESWSTGNKTLLTPEEETAMVKVQTLQALGVGDRPILPLLTLRVLQALLHDQGGSSCICNEA
jgi:hypothetical protein